jgi:tetratricopeptide (TPR) repeat protein
MYKTIATIAVAISVSTPGALMARDTPANQCYLETVKALQDQDATLLSTRACEKALRLGPHTDAQDSAMLHNKAIIERAMGKLDAARLSLDESVRLAPQAGKPHLALALMLHHHGDYAGAIELYRQLTHDSTASEFVIQNYDAIVRNMAYAQQAQEKLSASR